MELTPYLTHIKEIRKVMADTGLSLMPWDHEWDEFAAFGPKGANLTAQNIRGALKRMARAKGYAINILDPALRLPCDPEPTGVTFRIRKLDVSELPPQKKVERTPYEPAEVVEHLQRELF